MSLKEKIEERPASDTLAALMAENSPRSKEIVVTVQGKQLLLFRAWGNITAWEALKTEAQDWAKRLAKNKVRDQVTSGNAGYDAACWILAKTMVGSFPSFEENEPGKYQGVGEMEAPWTYAQWLDVARSIAGNVFEGISKQVDAQQTDSAKAEFIGTVAKEGED